ncbi:MAG: hypothetical protein QXI61_03200 [Nitrososphaerota archaeon]
MIRFISEMGNKYDGLFALQFRETNNEDEADVIFYADQLGMGIGVITFLSNTPPFEVVDCEVGIANIYVRSLVILHELYHTLGTHKTMKEASFWE